MKTFKQFLEEMATRDNDDVAGKFHVVRLARKGKDIRGSNAGNPKGVAKHLANVDDYESPSVASGTHINVYQVKSRAKRGEYKASNANKPDESDEVGVTAKHGAVWYSFGKRAKAKHKLVKSIPLKHVRAHMKQKYGYDNFDDSGYEIGGKAIHDVVSKHIKENKTEDLYKHKLEGIKDVHGDVHVRHQVNFEGRHVYTVHHQGKKIGSAKLSGQDHYVSDVDVQPEFRRKGIASKLYNFIEKHSGKPLKPSPMHQTPEGKALWKKRNEGK